MQAKQSAPGQWAAKQKDGLKRQGIEKEARRVAESGPADQEAFAAQKAETAAANRDREKPDGELTEGRPEQTENDYIHAHKDDLKIPLQPVGPYHRDEQSGENPEVDDINNGEEAQALREKRSGMEKAEGR